MQRQLSLDRIFKLGYTPTETPDEAGLLKASGVRMHLGGIEKRFGLLSFGNNPDDEPIIELRTSTFSAGQNLWRFTGNKLYRYNGNTGVWDDRTGALVISTTRWTSESLFGTFYASPAKVFDVGNSRGILKQTSLGGDLVGIDDTPGALQLIGYAGRLFAIGTVDAGGTVYPYEIAYSGVGFPEDWVDPVVGAGSLSLTSLSAPPQASFILSGRLVILTGDLTQGSIVYGSATADPSFPVSFDAVHGIGILCRRAITQCASDLVAFLGHDNFYIMTGTQQIPIGDAVSARALERINTERREEAFAFYQKGVNDITFVIPVGDADLEAYVYNLRTKTWAGPEPATNFTSVTQYQYTQTTTWADLLTATKKWTDLAGTRWDRLSRTSGAALTIIGKSTGDTIQIDAGLPGDANYAIDCELISGDFNAEGIQFFAPGKAVVGEAADELACFGMFIRHEGTFTPLISISADGGETWKEVWTQTLDGGVETQDQVFTFNDIVGRQFRIKIRHISHTEFFKIKKLALQVRWLRKIRGG